MQMVVAYLHSFISFLSLSLILASLVNADVPGLDPFSGGSLLSNFPVCKTPLRRQGLAGPKDPFWLEAIKHQGRSPFNPDPAGYRVFRNVKDFGAVGDGIHDDTIAINNAISFQDRCGKGECPSSTLSPAVVYFPKGTYLISSSIIPYYYTQLIGDAKHPPTLLAAPTFSDLALIDADPYLPGGAQWYINQVNFFRSVRNFVIDLRPVPPENASGTGIHWQVSQATSLMNIVIHMSNATNTAHQGIWMENGSGGYMGDMVFNGGKYGIWGGNQQFTVRNLTVNNAQTGIFSVWNWGWTYQGITLKDCGVGFDLQTPSTGAQAIIDATVVNTPIFIRNSQPSGGSVAGSGSLVINNARLQNVSIAVGVLNGPVLLEGGTKTIASWVQGNVYKGENPQGQFVQGDLANTQKISNRLLDQTGRVVGRMHPQYESFLVSDFVSVKDYGAKGDGVTDDTQALQRVLTHFAGCKIIFFDAGTYMLTDTLYIPPGTRMVGEAWTVLSGKGAKFQSQKDPRVVVKVGNPGDTGIIEISDIIFSTVGPTAGAIIVEWNIREPGGTQAGAAMWDSHIRTGGAAGTQLENAQCPKSGSGGVDPCFAAFLHLHITKGATAYLEGTWVWQADHDLDGDGGSQITVYSGRGILSESQGPVWLIGTASEHHAVYQYHLSGARDHYMGLIQTESPYYQPTPAAPAPFVFNPKYDPEVYNEPDPSAWALSIQKSKDVFVFGAGLYSFFKNYTQECIGARNCQSQIANIDQRSRVSIFSLATVAAAKQISINGKGIVDQADNVNGFVSTVTAWSSE